MAAKRAKRPLKKSDLTWEDREKKACSRYCKVPIEDISHIETPVDGGGHFTGIRVHLFSGDTRWIDVGRNVRSFVETHG